MRSIGSATSTPTASAPLSVISATARPAPQPTSTTRAPVRRPSSRYERSRSSVAPGNASAASRRVTSASISSCVDMRDMLRLNVGMKSTDGMGIGAVAARFGLATHVLRHWESVGLLSPERVGDRRRYGPDDLYRVAVILRAKEAGLALEDIRRFIAARDPAARRAT